MPPKPRRSPLSCRWQHHLLSPRGRSQPLETARGQVVQGQVGGPEQQGGAAPAAARQLRSGQQGEACGHRVMGGSQRGAAGSPRKAWGAERQQGTVRPKPQRRCREGAWKACKAGWGASGTQRAWGGSEEGYWGARKNMGAQRRHSLTCVLSRVRPLRPHGL